MERGLVVNQFFLPPGSIPGLGTMEDLFATPEWHMYVQPLMAKVQALKDERDTALTRAQSAEVELSALRAAEAEADRLIDDCWNELPDADRLHTLPKAIRALRTQLQALGVPPEVRVVHDTQLHAYALSVNGREILRTRPGIQCEDLHYAADQLRFALPDGPTPAAGTRDERLSAIPFAEAVRELVEAPEDAPLSTAWAMLQERFADRDRAVAEAVDAAYVRAFVTMREVIAEDRRAHIQTWRDPSALVDEAFRRIRQRPTPPAGETKTSGTDKRDLDAPATRVDLSASDSPGSAALGPETRADSREQTGTSPPRVCPRCGETCFECVVLEAGRVEAKGEEPSPTCRHYDEDESGAQVGDACGKPAKWLNCQWVGGMPVCDEHRCRCRKPIEQPTPVTGEAAGREVVRVDVDGITQYIYAGSTLLDTWHNEPLAREYAAKINAAIAAQVARAEARAREEAYERAAKKCEEIRAEDASEGETPVYKAYINGFNDACRLCARHIRALGAGEGKR